MRSPRSLVPVLGWCAATVTSVALASVAMLPVLRTATPDESSLVSVDQLRESGEIEPASPPAPTTSSPSPSPSATASPSRTKPRKSPARTSASPSPSPAETTKAPEETSTEVVDGWTVTTDGDGDKTYVRSFRVEGGSTVIRMTEDKVELVTATPSDGYSVATVQNEPDNLAVYFNEVNHSFVIHAVWNVDRPFAEVSEIGK